MPLVRKRTIRPLPVSADVDDALRRDGDRARREELPGLGAARADRADDLAAAVEDEHARALLVEHVQKSARVKSDGYRVREQGRAGRGRAERRAHAAVGVEQLDAAVDGVRHRADAARVRGSRPSGRMNWPVTRPLEPSQPFGAPPTSKTSIRLPPGSATYVLPVASTLSLTRVLQLPEPGAVRAPAPTVGVVRRRAVADDAVVDVVGHEHAPERVDADVVRGSSAGRGWVPGRSRRS